MVTLACSICNVWGFCGCGPYKFEERESVCLREREYGKERESVCGPKMCGCGPQHQSSHTTI